MQYDVAVIGSGWAGFNAALKAKTLGLEVCLIEKSQIGGTCLNSGCIPTKALLQSAKAFSNSKKSSIFGIEESQPKVNFSKVQERKDKIISQLRLGMNSMLKGIDFLSASAQIIASDEIKIGAETIKAKSIIIATGSSPIELSQFKFDKQKILSSDDILELKLVPDSILIVGGGFIGCEFASLFSALGSRVTVVEKMPQILPGEDKEIVKKIETIFKKKGIKIHTGTDASSLNLNDYTLVLVCVGRAPRIEGLGLDTLGMKIDRKRIVVDEYLRTSIPNIYAAGDCTGKIMLAHYAAYQGRIASGNIASPENQKKADNQNVPSCIFTDPEIASVGIKEEDAKIKGMDIIINKFDFLGSGMARILDETEGFIKIISDKNSRRLLGASIIGPKATELIAGLTLALTNGLTIPQIKDTIFAHPTLSESIHEALG